MLTKYQGLKQSLAQDLSVVIVSGLIEMEKTLGTSFNAVQLSKEGQSPVSIVKCVSKLCDW